VTPEEENRLRAKVMHMVSGLVLEIDSADQIAALEATYEAALTMRLAIGPVDLEVLAYRVIAKARAAGLQGRPSAWRPIVAAVAERHGLAVTDLVGPSRKQDICMARHEAMYVLRSVLTEEDRPRWSLPAVGRMFNRDHTTILNGVRAHQAILDATARDIAQREAA
jgi:chromosomal replication initiation ATPase DnaA